MESVKETNFYVTLPSSAATGQSLSEFTVSLPYTLRLDGQWYVGLSELVYPASWYNVGAPGSGSGISLLLLLPDKLSYVVGIPEGFYSSADDLVGTLYSRVRQAARKIAAHLETDRIKNRKPNGRGEWKSERFDADSLPSVPDTDRDDDSMRNFAVFIDFDKITQKIKLQIPSESAVTEVVLDDNTRYVMGFSDSQKYLKRDKNRGVHTAAFPPDLTAHTSLIYVYTDIIQSNAVGGVMAPLLNTVPHDMLKHKFGSMCYFSRPNTFYYPLLRREISSIRITLKNEQGEAAAFKFGKVLAKLHFIKINGSL